MGSHARVTERRRLQRAKGRFQQWAASFLQSRRAEMEQRMNASTAEEERRRRGDRASANTRMANKPAGIYCSGSQTYKPRDPQQVINRRRLGKAHRTQITSAAEIGLRLHENFVIIGLRCGDERRRGDG